MWGVYELAEEIHVIPCDDKGKIVEPHTLIDCFCHPETIIIDGGIKDIINHAMEH